MMFLHLAGFRHHKSMPAALLPLASIMAALGVAMLAPAGAARAQAVVQALPDPASEQLNEALRRLSRNPESLPALIDAGRASIELGDIDAAEGFFNRARAVDADDGRALAGQALVALRRQDPVTALELFDRAEAAGENLDPYATDRGLAFDLIGENAQAQSLYSSALARSENPETIRRLALSHAISGDQAAFEAVLLPSLQRRDLAAYRARAFGLAILGQEEEAITIAETMLPARLSSRLAPYLRYMPRLTRAQQAAAANLGRFPEVADIGREDPQLARRVITPANPRPSGRSDARLIPEGEPLGRSARARTQVDQELPALAPSQAQQQRQSEVAAVVASVEQEADSRRPASVAAAEPQDLLPGPSFSLAASTPEHSAPEPEPQVSLADAFADFSLPDADAPVQAAAGAVDITTIEPVREERVPEPPPPPPHPSRHWVQVATGQDISAFRFDWRRIARTANGALDGFSPYRARWNATNRLLTGPFDSAGEAQRFVTRLAEEGIDSFRFTSAEGEEVLALD